MTGKTVICLSSIDWDFIWQGHQEIMAALARQGNRVLFVENTGVRSPRLKDWPRLTHRLRSWLRGTKGFRQELDHLFIYSPLVLPFPYSRLARRLNRVLLRRALQRWMHAVGIRRPVLWTFLPTPLACDMIQDLDPALTVYYCIDDLASSSSSARRIHRSEAWLFRHADLVFVTSDKLRQRAAQFTDRVSLFPFGVAFEKFDAVRDRVDEEPEELKQLPRPMVGYIGGLHQWVDQALVAAVARRMPQTSFVLVGPPQTNLSQLASASNVHLLGAKPHDELPRYAKQFDIGIVPYRLSDYTAHVYPTKLNEYLAMGIPVVATGIPEILRFNAEHGGVVAVARDAEEFSRAIETCLRQNSPDMIQRRIEVARQNSWPRRIAQMSALIEEQLRTKERAGPRWQETLRRLYGDARRRLFRATAAVAIAYLCLFHTPFIWVVAEPLRVADPPRQADVIVVLAGGVGESGKAGGGYQERVKQAVDLYQAGYASRIIFSSGFTFVFPEAVVMKKLAVSLGVPESAILTETDAASTVAHVRAVSRLLGEERRPSILLVGAPYHMRRAVWTFRKVAPEVTVIPTPVAVQASEFYAHHGKTRWEQIRGILHEYAAILYYWWKGWV